MCADVNMNTDGQDGPGEHTPWIAPDGWRVIIARAVRTFGYGFTSVLLGIALAGAGFSTVQIGLLLTFALVGDMLAITLVAWFADRVGRRRVLVFFALLMAVSGFAFAFTHNLFALLLAAFLGTVSPSNADNTPFSAIEQAILPQTTARERRTDVFARYSLWAQLAGAAGGLAAALPDLLHRSLNVPIDAGVRIMFGGYGALALLLVGVFLTMSEKVEPEKAQAAPDKRRQRLPLNRSRGIVLRLSSFFAVDAFAGGLVVQTIMSLWFHERFGVSLSMLGVLFFGTNLISALSFLVAARLAKRIGLLNTMVFTHLPSNILLMLVALMPSFPLAAAFLLARQMLSQMDVPTRQAYTMALVTPEERTAAASATTIARSVALSFSPLLAGLLIAAPVLDLGLPFLVSGGMKALYDLALYGTFRKVKPPSS